MFVYFDGRDHRTKAKIEELLSGQKIAFKVLDVTDDEAEKSWVTTTAHMNELPIVVIAGAPIGGLGELTQLNLSGELHRRVFWRERARRSARRARFLTRPAGGRARSASRVAASREGSRVGGVARRLLRSGVMAHLPPGISSGLPSLPGRHCPARDRPQMTLAALERFACLAERCEDSCCRDWAVSIDRPSLDRLKGVMARTPAGRDRLVRLVVLGSPSRHVDALGQVQLDENGVCRLLDSDNRCSVQAAYGEAGAAHDLRDLSAHRARGRAIGSRSADRSAAPRSRGWSCCRPTSWRCAPRASRCSRATTSARPSASAAPTRTRITS